MPGFTATSCRHWRDILKCHMCSQNLNTADIACCIPVKVEGKKKKKKLLLTQTARLCFRRRCRNLLEETIYFELLFPQAYNGFLKLQSRDVKMWTYYVLRRRWQEWPVGPGECWLITPCTLAERMAPSDAAQVKRRGGVSRLPIYSSLRPWNGL